MSHYESFKKDWKITKSTMEKELSAKKPAEKKSYDLGFAKIEKRVSSGIGKSLDALDKAQPKDAQKPKPKEAQAFSDALKTARSAIQSELNAINTEVKSLKGEDAKFDKSFKDSSYRALKVFKAKLEHYLAVAEQDEKQYQHAVKVAAKGQAASDAATRDLQKFKAKYKQELTLGVLEVKKTLAKPDLPNLQNCRLTLSNCLEVVGMADTDWQVSMSDGGKAVKEFKAETQKLNDDLAKIKLPAENPDDIKAAASAIGKLVKKAIEALGRVPDNA